MFTTPLAETALALLAAMILAARFGEPRAVYARVPHPAVLMGRAVALATRLLNRGRWRRLKGALAMALLCLAALALGWLISFAGPFGEVVVAAALLAHKSLMDHVQAVADALEVDVDAGRRAVAHIVGRDLDGLEEAAVARAAIESGAENFSDAVVAPAFWLLAFGAPGIIFYKLVNTADSMIGHRTPELEAFGWAAARLDDLLNLIPARVAGVLIGLAALKPEAFQVMFEDAGKHRSPNAGWPEAATAGALGLALAGPLGYGGRETSDPYLNWKGREAAQSDDIRAAVDLYWRAWALLLGVVVLIAALALKTA